MAGGLPPGITRELRFAMKAELQGKSNRFTFYSSLLLFFALFRSPA